MKKSFSNTSINSSTCSINISPLNSGLGLGGPGPGLGGPGGMRKSVSTNSLLSMDYELSNEHLHNLHNDMEYMVSKMPITKLANCNLSKYINLPTAPSIQVDELETVGACLAEPCEVIDAENILNINNVQNIRYYWLERSLDEKEIGIRHANLYARFRRKKNKI